MKQNTFSHLCTLLLAVLLTAALLPLSALTTSAASSDFVINKDGVLTDYNGPGGHVVIPDGVKTVDGFRNCASLLSVTFPDSVTTIWHSAFEGCSSLTQVTLPNSVTAIGNQAFMDCVNLEKINIPSGVTWIGNSTFYNCLKLKEITLPDGVTQIGNNAFEQCTSLERINIPKGVTSIGMWAFCRCSALTEISLPDGLKDIGTKAFAYSGLEEITIPGTVVVDDDDGSKDGTCAFEGCRNLTKAVICEGVNKIPLNEFWNCTKLATVYIPKSVTMIGETSSSGGYTFESGAFTGADALTDVYYAGTQAQWNQINIYRPKYSDPTKVYPLDSASIHYNSTIPANSYNPGGPGAPSTPETPSTATTAKTSDANGNIFEFTLDTASNTWTLTRFTAGSNPKNVTVPATVEGKAVTAIGSAAFMAQAAVETVQLPDAVTMIGSRAFLNCWALKAVNIPKSTQFIGYCAFENCKLLQDVELPITLTTIETRAFRNCASLTKVALPDSLINLGSKTVEPDNWGMTGMVFAGCTAIKDISLGSGAADFFQAFDGAAVETGVVPQTVTKSLTTQSDIRRDQYQTFGMYANCKSLKTGYVESGVKKLFLTFQGCSNLEALYLPKTILELNGAFDSISKDIPNRHLDIYYEGNQAEFDKIELYSSYCATDAMGKGRTASQKIAEINEKKPNGLTVTVHLNSYTPFKVVSDHSRVALEAANALRDLGLFNGVGNDASGNPIYALDRVPTRYEAVTMLVRLLGKEDEAKAGVWSTPFTDVVDWAKPYVGYAYANGLTNGVTATQFSGQSIATKEQYATFILRALGYTSGTDFQWNAPWDLLGKTGIMLSDSEYWSAWEHVTNASFYREDVVLMSFLSLSAKPKGTNTTLIDQILDEDGSHTHSYLTYSLPATGSYESIPVEQQKMYTIEYHCTGCDYITHDYNDLNAHQDLFGDESLCFASSNTYPATGEVNGVPHVNYPWYSSTIKWIQKSAPCTLRICTMCGKAA